MSWHRRVRELLLAGGAIVVGGCPLDSGIPCGNANPDPCICDRPSSSSTAAAHCAMERACQADGGRWVEDSLVTVDGATTVQPSCEPLDAGTAAMTTDAGAD